MPTRLLRAWCVTMSVAPAIRPTGSPVLTWYEISDDEAECCRDASGAPMVLSGDWRVRGVTEVAEDRERSTGQPCAAGSAEAPRTIFMPAFRDGSLEADGVR